MNIFEVNGMFAHFNFLGTIPKEYEKLNNKIVYDDKKYPEVDIVSDNPYLLVEDIDCIGFLSADKISPAVPVCSSFST